MRARFEAPASDLSKPDFVDRFIEAAFSDAEDRVPSLADRVYWRDVMPSLIDRAREVNIPDYPWRRLIGQGAGGSDVARYGPYAVPPNIGPAGGWTTTPSIDQPVAGTDTPQPAAPPPPPPGSDELVQVIQRLGMIVDGLNVTNAGIAALAARIDKLQHDGIRVHL